MLLLLGNNFYTWVLGEPMYGFEKRPLVLF